MSVLDLSPKAAAAPRARRIAAHARMEASLLLRNGEQLLLALVIPVALLVAWRFVLPPTLVDAQSFPAAVLALAVWSSGFTSLAIATAFELRYGVLERLAATPLRKADLIAGKALATVAITVGQLAVLSAIAVGLGWRPEVPGAASFGWGVLPGLAGLPVVIAAIALALATFASWGLALASRLRAEAVLGLANLIYLVGAAAGGIVLPAPWAWWLPTAALGDVLRGYAVGWTPLTPLLVLLAWAAASALVARKVFRWLS